MPRVIQQKPLGTPSTNGSVLSRAVPVSSLVEQWIKLTIYGQNRVGKTTLACDFPKPLLLISFEPNRTGGAMSVRKIPGVTYLQITSSHDALSLAAELRTDKTFKTHVLDTATSLQDIILQELLNLPAVPEQLNWGTVSMDAYRQRSEKTKETLRPFLNLPAHTIICAKEKDHNPPKEDRNKITRGMQLESFIASDLGGATVGWLHDACDYIGRLYLAKEVIVKEFKSKVGKEEIITTSEEETGRIVRRLRTMYHPNFAAGFRSADPSNVPDHIEDPSYERISAVIKGVRIPAKGAPQTVK